MSDLGNVPTLADIPADAAGRGWTPAAKVRFLEHLAWKGNVRAACACVGLSAEAAYRLRRRDALFARAWTAAVVMARDHSIEVMACRALDGVEEPVLYRGEQVGTRTRYDTRLLLAHIARLDQLADNAAAQWDAGQFDALLAALAEVPCPDDLAGSDGLAFPHETAVGHAVDDAERALFCDGDDEEDDADDYDDYGDDDEHGEEDCAYGDEWEDETGGRDVDRGDGGAAACCAARSAASVHTAALSDRWQDAACLAVDSLAARAPGDGAGDGRGSGNGECGGQSAVQSPLHVTPCTVSTVSTSPPVVAAVNSAMHLVPDAAACRAQARLHQRM